MPSSSTSSSSSSFHSLWRRRHSIFFPFTCRCANSTSVSISPLTSISSSSSSSSTSRQRRQPNISSTTTSSYLSPLLPENPPQSDSDCDDAASFSDLLQELDELERSVIELGGPPTRRMERWKESVAVEKETEDPVGELRRSMMAMVAGRATVCGRDMVELLTRFLTVNKPANHPLVIKAFKRVWGELFSGETPPPFWLFLHGRGQYYS